MPEHCKETSVAIRGVILEMCEAGKYWNQISSETQVHTNTARKIVK